MWRCDLSTITFNHHGVQVYAQGKERKNYSSTKERITANPFKMQVLPWIVFLLLMSKGRRLEKII